MSLDYNQLAQTYDSHRSGGGPYGETLLRLARQTPHREVLELGAGTGLNTAFFLKHLSCRLVALELSPGMLAKGHAKGLHAHWVNANATALPFADASFDFLFGAYMLHHIRDLSVLFRAAHRVLRPGGCAAVVTVSHDFIRAHPMNHYFPSFARIDLARFQPVPEVEAAMIMAGFQNVASITDVDPPRVIDQEYVERVANRFISTYDLLPEPEFVGGVKHLREDVLRDLPQRPRILAREATTISGFRG